MFTYDQEVRKVPLGHDLLLESYRMRGRVSQAREGEETGRRIPSPKTEPLLKIERFGGLCFGWGGRNGTLWGVSPPEVCLICIPLMPLLR